MSEVRKQPELDAASLEAAAQAVAGPLIASFKDGFGNSSEGYNAEYGPLDDDVTDSAIDAVKEYQTIAARAAILAFLEAERAQGRAMMPRIATLKMLQDTHPMTFPLVGAIAVDGASLWRAMFDAFETAPTEVRKQAGDVS